MISQLRIQLGIKGRLYLLVALFALGCGALASVLIWLQSEHAIEARKQSLHQLVATAHGVLAAHKALADSGAMPEAEARKRALDVIGAMWYGKADYFTARDTNGISLLNPAAPEKVGKNRDETTDSHGYHYSRRMTELVRDPGEGYVTYYTLNPETKVDAEKTSFIKTYKPWGIGIAAGVFTDDISVEIYKAMTQAAIITFVLVALLGAVAIWQSRNGASRRRAPAHRGSAPPARSRTGFRGWLSREQSGQDRAG
jgi:methyl-accepting chemotaxis protein